MVFFGVLLSTMSFSDTPPPVTVNLSVNPKDETKIVKASIVDKKAIDAAVLRQTQAAAEELNRQRQAQEQLLANERRAEQLKQEAAAAKLALENANAQKLKVEAAAKKAAEQKAKLEQEQQKMQKQAVAQAQAKKLQEKKDLEKLQATQKAAAQQLAAKAQADKARLAEAAALKATRDRLAAEHQEFLLDEVEKHRAIFHSLIEDNRILATTFSADMVCKIRIKLLPDGSIANVEFIERSGNPAYDDMSATAVYKSAPFPMPQDQELYGQLRDIILSFKNGEQASDVL